MKKIKIFDELNDLNVRKRIENIRRRCEQHFYNTEVRKPKLPPPKQEV